MFIQFFFIQHFGRKSKVAESEISGVDEQTI